MYAKVSLPTRSAVRRRSRHGLGGIGDADEVRTGQGRRWADPLAAGS